MTYLSIFCALPESLHLAISPHAVFDVVINNGIKFLVCESVMLCEYAVDF
jgi:hypothetical protein